MTNSSQLAAIARLFSSAVLREMARQGSSALFARLAREAIASSNLSAESRVGGFFDAAFELFKRIDCRHEYIYKATVTQKILLGRHSLQTASMLSEFRIGDCKADVSILNGTATVYEIKSERDSLSRLEKQIETYKSFYAKVYVIAGVNHVEAIRGMVSDDVGIMILSSRHQITTLREAVDCPERTSPITIFESIRTAEAKQILELMGVDIPEVPNTQMRAVLREYFVKLSSRDAHTGMVTILKRTRNLQPLSALVQSLPRSLHSSVLSVPLRRIDHERLLRAVETPLAQALCWS
jgi:hypothetical protein